MGDKPDNLADQAKDNPGIDVYDWVVIGRDLFIDVSPTLISVISVVVGIWAFAFSDIPPERLNTLSVFLGGGAMAQTAAPSKARRKK